MVGAGQGGGYPPHLAWWTGGQGGGARARGGCKGLETRAPGTEQISQRVSCFWRF